MRVGVLGPLVVAVADRPVRLGGPVQRRLLAALVARAPTVVPAPVLVTDLWEDVAPPTAARTLHSHVARLRAALGGGEACAVQTVDGGYRLAVDQVSVDARRFEHLVDEATRLQQRPDAAARRLREALDLWRGPAYAEFVGAPFADQESLRLQALRETALEARVDADLACGRGADLVPELEALVAAYPFRERLWAALMVALYRCGRQAESLAVYQRARALLGEELGVEPGPQLRAAEAQVLAQDPGLLIAATTTPVVCPWKGLATYEAADADYFVGRERLVAEVVGRLVDTSMVVVTGESGSGKSSLVRAGVLPVLAGGGVLGSADWRIRVLVAGPDVDLAEAVADRPDLLVVDQAEGLFVGATPATLRAAGTALGTLQRRGGRVLLVLRGDRYGQLAAVPGLTFTAAAGTILVGALGPADLRRVVLEPARRAGLSVEPALVEAVVAEVDGRPAALPLLSTALVRTWERRDDGSLTLAGYRDAGGLASALQRLADEAMQTLDEAEVRAVRRVLLRLVSYDGERWTVRRVPLTAAVRAGDPADAAALDTLVRHRLVTLGRERVGLMHEALLTAWPRLVDWLAERVTTAAVAEHLAGAARDWAAGGRDPVDLYRGARLHAALDFERAYPDDVDAGGREFLAAGRAAADRELRRVRAGRRRLALVAAGLVVLLGAAVVAGLVAAHRGREAQAAARAADARRIGMEALRVGDRVGALLTAVAAVRLDRSAATESLLLAVLARADLPTRSLPLRSTAADVTVSADGWLAVVESDGLVEVFDAALDRVNTADPRDSWEHGAVAHVVEWLSGSDYLMVGALGPPRVFRMAVRSGRAALLTPAWDPPTATTTSDRRWLVGLRPAVAGVRPAVLLALDLTGSGAQAVIPLAAAPQRVLAAGESTVVVAQGAAGLEIVDLSSSARSPREGRLAGVTAAAPGPVVARAGAGGTVAVLDARTGRDLVSLSGLRSAATALSFSPDGRLLAAVDHGDGTVLVWDVARGAPIRRLDPAGRATSAVAWAPDGRTLITAARDEPVLQTWDLDPGPDVAGTALAPAPGGLAAASAAAIDPVRGTVAVGTRSGGVWVGDLRSGLTRHATTGDESGSPVLSLAFVEDGRRILAADAAGVLTVWDVASAVPVDRLTSTSGRVLGAHAVLSPDGRTAAAFADGYALSIVDVPSRRVLRTVHPPLQTHQRFQVLGWHPDGRSVLVRAADLDTAGVWALVEVDTGAVQWSVRAPEEVGAPDVAFVSGGRQVVVLGASGTPHVLSVAPGTTAAAPVSAADAEAESIPPLDRMGDLAVSPDGSTVATLDPLGEVVLRDPETGRSRGSFAAQGVRLLRFASDHELVAIGADGALVAFDVDPDSWLEQACRIAGRDMTEAEWSALLPGQPAEPVCPTASAPR